jgi:ubiquinone/menaquinone biosynthesis C-methylase UbiE
MRRATHARELIDGVVPLADLAASLGDIDRLAAWFGGHALSLARVRRAARAVSRARALMVVDVGGGAGGFARRVVRWARRRGRLVRVVVVERDAAAAQLARRPSAASPEIAIIRADATALPLAAESADVVHAALTLHHLEPEAAVIALAEMARVARGRVVVNDLARSRLALVLVWLATRVIAAHPISRHDGPLSVRRAYAAAEVADLFRRAGVPDVTVQRYHVIARLVAETAA